MVKKFLHIFLSEYCKVKLKKTNVRFLQNSLIDKSVSFEGYNSVGENNIISNTYFGYGSYTGKNVQFNGVKIGRFCSIGSFIRNTTGRHPSSVYVSTHPAFFSIGKAAGFTFSNKQKFKELKIIKIHNKSCLVSIGNDVWIGDNVTINDGVTIGDGAIIGTGALVTKDIEPYSINVGVPSRQIKYRFTPDQIDFLLRFKWWNKDLEWIKQNWETFDNIEIFIQKFNDKKN